MEPRFGNGPSLQGIRYNGMSTGTVRNRPLDMSSRWFTALVQDRRGSITIDPDTGGPLLVCTGCGRSIWALLHEYYRVVETKGFIPKPDPEAEFRALTAGVELTLTAGRSGRVSLVSQ